MIIRKANQSDNEQMQRLLIEFDRFTKDYLSMEIQPFEEYKDTNKLIAETVNMYLTDPNFITYVAENNGILAGYICGQINPKPNRKLDKEGHVQDWFVSENYRSQHIGKELFDTLIEEFKKLECTHVTLDVFSDNNSAKEIYHKLGFYDRILSLVKTL